MDPQRRHELSRLLSRLDRLEPGETLPQVKDCRPVREAFRIGITGPLGAGKSTLINQLTGHYRQRDVTVGVIAVDPSSPFTGGALLGDRVRMSDLAMDDGVFIRSLATRGASGGLAASAADAADLLDAFGFDRIIIETVGVGQSEVDIAGACDATVVVFDPGSGDGIQAMKAGLMEIADLFVVNKKDMRGADRFILDLETVLGMKAERNRPHILATVATTGEGMSDLRDWLEEYFQRIKGNGDLEHRRSEQRSRRIRRAAQDAIVRKLWDTVPQEQVERAVQSGLPVKEAALELIGNFFPRGDVDG